MNSDQNKVQVMRTLWGALLMSHCLFIYLTINYLHSESAVGPDDMMMKILPFMAFIAAIASFWINRKAQVQKTFDQYFVFSILSCALAESVHIFGIVGIVLSLPLNYYFSFAASGIALHLYYFPRKFPAE